MPKRDLQTIQKLSSIRREQRWKVDTANILIAFVERLDTKHSTLPSEKTLLVKRAYEKLGNAIDALRLISKRTVPVDMLYRLIELQHELLGQSPPEITKSQWQTWNLAPFFVGKKKWHAFQFFLETITGKYHSPDALRMEHQRIKTVFQSLPLDHDLALHLDRLRGHRQRSRIRTITERSAFSRLQLSLRRHSSSKHSPLR